MQMTAVYACVRILAEAIAGLPLHLYRHGENSSKQKAKEHPLYSLLHAEPNVEMTSFVFRENGDVSGDVSGGVSGGVSSDVDYSDTHLSKNAMRVYQMDRGVYWSSRLQECSDIWIPILSILWQSP